MKTLELFCGTKSFTKIAEKHGHTTTTLDILPNFNPTYCCDIMEWNYKELPVGYFDIIWASPNCKDQEFMQYIPYNDIDYCKYGYNYRKRTRIWNNNENWTGKILCKKDSYCENKKAEGKHIHFRWITRGSGTTSLWEERISIPKLLMEEILLLSN